MRNLLFILITVSFVSCLKKIEEVDTANTNIYDPNYAGGQWWIYEDVFLWTDQINNQWIRFELSVPETYVPTIKPTFIDLGVTVNSGTEYFPKASISPSGDYEAVLDISYTVATDFCLDVGVYVEEQDTTINVFTDCKSL